ncbi:MAG: hypothetical protein JWQ16_3445 [Novosphingobium sp.]|nr:hypothetical protein [Novosphingobium sp.]
MARSVRFHSFGGPEVLQLDQVEVRAPGPGEVGIRVAAIGLSRVESLYRGGGFGPVSFPATIGYEAAGVIKEIGPGVTGFAPGDRVAVLYGLSMEQYGTNAEQIVYPTEWLVKVPPSQSLVEAAASWMQYGTAYALVGIGGVRSSDHVVITAASSSVGQAAIQVAGLHGAIPIAVTRGRAKAARLMELGAAHVIVSDEEDVADRVRQITQGQGARLAFDAVGGAPLGKLLPALAPEGIAIVYGMLGGYTFEAPLPPLMLANLTLRGWSADLMTAHADKRAKLVDYVAPLLASGGLRPVIARTFPIEQIVEAHRYLESNEQIGKIVVTTGSGDE